MKMFTTAAFCFAVSCTTAFAQDLGTIKDGIAFGIDDNEYANDNECDDRRFSVRLWL